jgi:spore photoproduct lyase
MQKLLKTDRASPRPLTFEIGSNSDLVLENAVTGNLPWTIESFADAGHGRLTFPQSFIWWSRCWNLHTRGRRLSG